MTDFGPPAAADAKFIDEIAGIYREYLTSFYKEGCPPEMVAESLRMFDAADEQARKCGKTAYYYFMECMTKAMFDAQKAAGYTEEQIDAAHANAIHWAKEFTGGEPEPMTRLVLETARKGPQ